jgi:hypothetical protein
MFSRPKAPTQKSVKSTVSKMKKTAKQSADRERKNIDTLFRSPEILFKEYKSKKKNEERRISTSKTGTS